MLKRKQTTEVLKKQLTFKIPENVNNQLKMLIISWKCKQSAENVNKQQIFRQTVRNVYTKTKCNQTSEYVRKKDRYPYQWIHFKM